VLKEVRGFFVNQSVGMSCCGHETSLQMQFYTFSMPIYLACRKW
jgi:hypothetical protein